MSKAFAVISVDAGEDGHEATAQITGIYLTRKEATAAKKAAMKDFKAESNEDFPGTAYMYDKDTVLVADGQYGARFIVQEIEIPEA